MRRAFIMGFVGAGNLGDEAILAGTLKFWRESASPDPAVFSWNPEETSRLHAVKALPVKAGLSGLWDFASYLRPGDLLVLGGGSLLQDGERRIVPFWLARAVVARLRGCRVVYHAQGIGPLRTWLGRSLVRVLVPVTAYAVTVRDESSRQLISYASPQLVADPALLLPPLERLVVAGQVVVALRAGGAEKNAQSQLLKILASFKEQRNINFVFLAMHYPEDVALAGEFASALGGVVIARPSLDEARAVFAGAELVLAMRLHAAILAAGVHTPTVGLSYDPKVAAFFASIGQAALAIPWGARFAPEELIAVLNRVYADGPRYSEEMCAALLPARDRAAQAVRLLLEWGE